MERNVWNVICYFQFSHLFFSLIAFMSDNKVVLLPEIEIQINPLRS